MKRLLTLIAATAVVSSAFAQTILSEDFETGTGALTPITVGEGWTTVNGYSGTNASYNWHNYFSPPTDEKKATISGNCCAAVTGPISDSDEGIGPREEILLTPELNLDDTYQLQFTWRVSPMNAYDKTRYDFQVRVVENGNLKGAETIFSIQNEKMLRESGVTVFPITNWDPYTSRVDLSDYKGSKVQLAFVYKMMTEISNVLWLDDISVKKYDAPTGPVAKLSNNKYAFPAAYLGERLYSDVFTLTNTGKDGLKVTAVEAPAGVEVMLNTENLNLAAYQKVDFRLAYNAAMTSATKGAVVLKTTGGDVTIDITASKQLVPDGSMLETFERIFPPAGWKTSGWDWHTGGLEGDHSAYCGGGFTAAYLRSPRLDLFDGGKLYFTYFNSYTGESVPEYDIELQVSYDGGDTWTTKWTTDYQNGLNQTLTAEVDLGYADDNCYVRWYYPAVESDDSGAFEHSSFYLDRVVLPNVYGQYGAPLAATDPKPATNTENIFPKNIVLSWSPALFAKGYKLFVGTDNKATDLINGLDLGDVLTYTVPEAAYSTTYRWKVVPYNDNGDCTTASTWRFTTQPDMSVSQFPFIENFTGKELPLGWTLSPSASYNRNWAINNLFPYQAEKEQYGVLFTTWLVAGESNAITSQEFTLPADAPMSISFLWGDEHPRQLIIDKTGLVKKNNVSPNNGQSENVFEILADGEWQELTTISEDYIYNNGDKTDNKYWIQEQIDLAPFAGKKVQFRWSHFSYGSHDPGASLTHIVLEENKDFKAALNLTEWRAGKVNYNKSVNSGNIFTLLNTGGQALTVESAKFNTANFSTTLAAGTNVAVGAGAQFAVQFDALTTNAEVNDVLTVTYNNGNTVQLAVSATALPEGTYYYSFEPNELEHDWTKDFTMIDADKSTNYDPGAYWIHYSAGGVKSAFTCESDSKEDGMYGIMSPVSGTHALVAASPVNANADNWIISRRVHATVESTFDFYGRNWESINSVLPDPKHRVTVLVSTTGNTKTADFSVVMKEQEMPFLGEGEWNHYTVDLSRFDGQDIYVALRHTTVGTSNLAFFDDFTLTKVDEYVSGIEGIAIEDGAYVEVFGLNGAKLSEGSADAIKAMPAGFYIIRATKGDRINTFKLVK